jgi:Na+/H+ antiporter NhaD/arsenite permease-like protein
MLGSTLTTVVFIVFGVVYLGMLLGGLPFLQLDRTGVALLGAIALIGAEAVSPEDAARSIHLPTLILLFSFMVISAQLRLGGFYSWVTRRLTALPLSAPALLAVLILVVAVLAAVFSNDIVCLAVAPVLIEACRGRRLDPIPFLLALACAANIGSAATLIGNPQNMLIGQTLNLPFYGYLARALAPVLFGLLFTWGFIAWQTRGRWTAPQDDAAGAAPAKSPEDEAVPLDFWQTAKGLSVAVALVAVFLFLPAWPRDVAALAGAGLLLTSRRLHSTKMLGLVDWELLILFIGLFVVNHTLEETGIIAEIVRRLAAAGVNLDHTGPLFVVTLLLSNVVSNVPAVMLLLPMTAHALAGPILALTSTLAGNLLVVGSIANIIVVSSAARRGIRIDWRRHARIGVPVTVATLAISALFVAR